MEFRKTSESDIEEICRLVKGAIDVMEKNGIPQWDEVYPAREDFLNDIKAESLYGGFIDGKIAVIFALNKWQDEAYFAADWTYRGENFCVIHRLCVNPEFQNQGIAKKTLNYIEEKLSGEGIESIRLDVFTQNPFALRLYEKAGYRKTGTADWRKGKFILMEKVLRGKKMTSSRKSLIFDLDGTLWDATGCAPAIWNRIFDKHSEVNFRMTQELAASLMGKTMEEIGEALFPDFSEEKRREIVDDFGFEEVAYLKEKGAVLYPGIQETIQKLSNDYDLYIVSNCQDGYVPAFMTAHKMEAFFKDIEMSGRTGMDKGRNICLIMERKGISKADAVYIGDTEGDEKATRFAGIPFVWAKYGFGKAASPDAVLNDIRELPALLSSLL